jgi:hypothetical protein
LAVLRFELSASRLLGNHFYHSSHSTSPEDPISVNKKVEHCAVTQEVHIRGSRSTPALAKKQDLFSKITRAERAKVVEHLPCKDKALSSTPSTAKKKKKEPQFLISP